MGKLKKKVKSLKCHPVNSSSHDVIEELFENLKPKSKIKNSPVINKKKIRNSEVNIQGTKNDNIQKTEEDTTNLPSPYSVTRQPEAPVHRIDKETGLPVYKAHLLKVGEGGGTNLCPFDCSCCF